jgi:hypothetical protein
VAIPNRAGTAQSITFPTVLTKTYGRMPFVVRPRASSHLAVTVTSATPDVCSASGATVTLLQAGTCTLWADQPGDSTFAAAPTATATFVVNPKKLTVSLAPATRAYGVADPAFVVKYGRFVTGDTAGSALSGAPGCTSNASLSSAPGIYVVTCVSGSLSSAKYSFVFRPGKLKIAQAVLTVTADNQRRVVGAANPPLTATIAGFTDGESLATSDVAGAPTCTTTAKASSVAGAYAIHCAKGTLTSTNYKFVFVAGTLNVTQTPPAARFRLSF